MSGTGTNPINRSTGTGDVYPDPVADEILQNNTYKELKGYKVVTAQPNDEINRILLRFADYLTEGATPILSSRHDQVKLKEAREAIQRLIVEAKHEIFNGGYAGYGGLLRTYMSDGPEALARHFMEMWVEIEKEYKASLNTQQETKLGYGPVVDMGNGLKKYTIGLDNTNKDGAE